MVIALESRQSKKCQHYIFGHWESQFFLILATCFFFPGRGLSFPDWQNGVVSFGSLDLWSNLKALFPNWKDVKRPQEPLLHYNWHRFTTGKLLNTEAFGHKKLPPHSARLPLFLFQNIRLNTEFFVKIGEIQDCRRMSQPQTIQRRRTKAFSWEHLWKLIPDRFSIHISLISQSYSHILWELLDYGYLPKLQLGDIQLLFRQHLSS